MATLIYKHSSLTQLKSLCGRLRSGMSINRINESNRINRKVVWITQKYIFTNIIQNFLQSSQLVNNPKHCCQFRRSKNNQSPRADCCNPKNSQLVEMFQEKSRIRLTSRTPTHDLPKKQQINDGAGWLIGHWGQMREAWPSKSNNIGFWVIVRQNSPADQLFPSYDAKRVRQMT